jgi:hypothetical protein
MKHTLRMTVCAAAVAFAIPALAQTTDAKPADETSGTSMSKPMHHHRHHGMMHRMHGKGMMHEGKMGGGDAETARLNAQSLQNARGSSMATSSPGTSSPGMSSPGMSSPAMTSGGSMPAGTMAPPAGGTGMTAPSPATH